MNNNEMVPPVKHGLISGTATTAVEGVRGGVKGLLKGGLIGAGLTAAIIGGGAFWLGVSVLGYTTGAAIALAAASAVGGTLLVGGLALIGMPFIGGLMTLGVGLGTLVGLAKGTSRGIDQVGQERGAANMLEAQVRVAEAQAAQPNIVVSAPSASNHHYNPYPAHGSANNPALQHVQAAANPHAYTAEEMANVGIEGKINADRLAAQQASRAGV